jgi:hypothetical protein
MDFSEKVTGIFIAKLVSFLGIGIGGEYGKADFDG